ncbi:ribosomal-protein-alanine acetyltransferase [Nocardioides gansuensis]|uniref:Ribosomal-protein-alanine acetyltransferase n=1 Tax=Nocardioides gansuensis TaxID=2138300 RepID=A0A2T8FG79_9ACTN|nr:GNAT family N-acetyltransferase [Nocardioides gansuensis]PVG84704.1 ribosomal-protein-alanine acetyltransferase [Nocardioides gansuensis]
MIRSATPADIPALAALEADLFGVDAWDEKALAAELTAPGRHFAVDDGLRGYVVTATAGDITDLLRIGVRPDCRRAGLASALLEEALAHTGEADRMLLEVSAGNRGAVAFYLARGFAQVDVRPHYYRDGSDALVLLRDLPQSGASRTGTPSSIRHNGDHD